MFKSFIITAVRNLLRNKTFSFIHIAGLTVGITCLIFIMRYVSYEQSFDKFPLEAKRTFRVTGSDYAQTPVPLCGSMKEFFPEIRQTLRINKLPRKLLSCGEKKFYEEGIILADPSIFDMFSYKLSKGDERTALDGPNSIVLTARMAKKYFGDENPLGKILTMDGWLEFQVSGVLKDAPQNSHLRFDFLCPLSRAKEIYSSPDFFDNYMNTFVFSYFSIEKSADVSSIKNRMEQFEKYYAAKMFFPFSLKFSLQPLTSIHLYSNLGGELEPNGDIKYVYIFLSVAVLILLIACINYVNLSSARYMTRIKEVGIRKVVGATRIQLAFQFIGEAFIVSFIAALLSLILVRLLTPFMTSFFGNEEALRSTSGSVLAYLGIITLLLGFLAGVFPALFISKFQAIRILNKAILFRESRINLRRLLVMFQFSISTALILLTIVINNQLSFIQNKNLGFSKEQVVVIPVEEGEVRQQHRALKNELLKDPSILSASFSSAIPGSVKWVTSFHWEDQKSQNDNTLNFIASDHDFLKTYKIQLASGRDFSEGFTSDEKRGYIINRAALERFGWKSPLGRRLELASRPEGRVVGVVKDFHFKSLYSKIEPLCIFIDPGAAGYLSVRIKTGDIHSVLSYMERTWKKFSSGRPFEYYFFDDYLSRLYGKEQNTGKLFVCFSAIAIFIACLGVFGLVAFTAEKRRKEIGIRKVLGASTFSIVKLLSGEFMLLIIAAAIIGCPVSYYFAQKWLNNFAYHVNITPWIFLAVILIVALMVLSTILAIAIKAANADAARNLRYE
ncbi:MAG: FtsX-like permease family protein [Ignavibacteria bacterium]|jgi:putative ABC transport system permease protein|nr:FtsX-like permease family protein [Ignavibacteria bacterium]MCU7504756.1 FtsX-like permease family protein [Ignavibacteria bacterium]MCU7516358.1 FtsX-like permease family protein [Ignavibacteria bacterium]